LILQAVNYIDKKGEQRPTVSMDMKTMVWFVAKFDHNLRLDVINFAFNKLQEDAQKEISETVEQLNEKLAYQQTLLEAEKGKVKNLEKSKFVDWDAEYSTVSRFLKEEDVRDVSATDILNTLEKHGQVSTVETTAVKRILTDESIGKLSKKQSLLFPKSFLKRMLNNFIETQSN